MDWSASTGAAYRHFGGLVNGRERSGRVALGSDRLGVVQPDEELAEPGVGPSAELVLELSFDLGHGAPDHRTQNSAALGEVHAF